MPSVTAAPKNAETFQKPAVLADKIKEQLNEEDILRRLKPFSCASDSRAWFELCLSLAVAVAFYIMPVYTPIKVVLITLIKLRLFVQFHDMAHNSFFSTFQMNKWVGRVIGSINDTPFEQWRGPHNTHHQHLANVEKNTEQQGELPTWTVEEYGQASPLWKLMYKVYRYPLVLFGLIPTFVFSISYRFWRFNMDCLITNLILATRLFVAWYFDFLIPEMITMSLAASIGFFLFFAQHTYNPFMEQRTEGYSAVKAGIYSCTFFNMNPIMHWFTANIGYHHIHHITTRVPSYYLADAHYATEDLWTDVHRITWWSSLALRNLALWDADNKRYMTIADAEKQLAAAETKRA